MARKFIVSDDFQELIETTGTIQNVSTAYKVGQITIYEGQFYR